MSSEPQTGAAAGHSVRNWCMALIGVLFVMRLGAISLADLFPEESYYWNYAKHLAPGYLDHPPMVSWLIYLGTSVFGDNEFGVRIGGTLCTLLTVFWTFRLTRLLYGTSAAWVASLTACCLPFFFFTGFMITPDAPLAACWAGMLYALALIFFEGRSSAWLGVGICLGLGMLSKYTIALLGPATLLFLVLDAPSRKWFRSPIPYLAVAFSIVLFSPVLWWNFQNAWASFAFQGAGRISEPRRFSFHEFLGSVFALLTPVGVWLGAKVLRSAAERRLLFVRVFTLLPLSVFVLFSLTHRVKLNWTGPIWLALLPCMAAGFLELSRTGWLRRAWVGTLCLLPAVYLGLLVYLSAGLPGVGYSKEVNLLPVGWKEFGKIVDEKKKAMIDKTGQRVLVVGLDRNFAASQATFYQSNREESVRETTGRHLFGGSSLMYEFWFPLEKLKGANLLLVSFKAKDLNRKSVIAQCGSLGPVEEHWIERRGKRICAFYTREALDYVPIVRPDDDESN